MQDSTVLQVELDGFALSVKTELSDLRLTRSRSSRRPRRSATIFAWCFRATRSSRRLAANTTPTTATRSTTTPTTTTTTATKPAVATAPPPTAQPPAPPVAIAAPAPIASQLQLQRRQSRSQSRRSGPRLERNRVLRDRRAGGTRCRRVPHEEEAEGRGRDVDDRRRRAAHARRQSEGRVARRRPARTIVAVTRHADPRARRHVAARHDHRAGRRAADRDHRECRSTSR